MFLFWKKNKNDSIQQLESFLGFKCKNVSLYYQAFTHPSKKDKQNYQRLEFLGDAVLNFVVASYVYREYPALSEGDLSKLRKKLVNKQILKQIALKLELDKWINHNLAPSELEKSFLYCDIIESLIGAIFIDRGISYAEEFIKEKIIKQFGEITKIEDIDYKSKIFHIAQKYRWKLKFKLAKIEKENKENYFTIELLLNDEKIAEGKHYNKKQAEQIASKEALKKLNIAIE